MKKLLAATLLAYAVLAGAGCIVTSVYPYYSDDTLVFEPALLGTWLGDEGKTSWHFYREGDKAYRVEIVENRLVDRKEDASTSALVVHVFRVGGTLFMDAFPAKVDDLSIPGHVLARCDLRPDTLTLRSLETEALERLKAGAALLHVHRLDDGSVADRPGGPQLAGTLLMAPTRQLQAFLAQHLDEPIYQESPDVLTRER